MSSQALTFCSHCPFAGPEISGNLFVRDRFAAENNPTTIAFGCRTIDEPEKHPNGAAYPFSVFTGQEPVTYGEQIVSAGSPGRPSYARPVLPIFVLAVRSSSARCLSASRNFGCWKPQSPSHSGYHVQLHDIPP